MKRGGGVEGAGRDHRKADEEDVMFAPGSGGHLWTGRRGYVEGPPLGGPRWRWGASPFAKDKIPDNQLLNAIAYLSFYGR